MHPSKLELEIMSNNTLIQLSQTLAKTAQCIMSINNDVIQYKLISNINKLSDIVFM
jgi:hypothetical protein